MTQPPASLAPGSARVRAARRSRRPLWPPPLHVIATVVTVTLAALALYLAPIFDLGFYYDDWRLLSFMQSAPGDGFLARVDICRDTDPASRVGNCIYHAAVNVAFGEHPWAYHLLSLVLVIATALLLFALLRRCRLGTWPALLASVLFVVYPGSDASRLWAAGLAGSAVLACYIVAVLLAMKGLRTRRLRWHVLSVCLFIALLLTNVAVVAPLAITALLYLAAMPGNRRAAIGRGLVDLALATGFVVLRSVLAAAPAASGVVEHRSPGEWVERVGAILRGAWDSFTPLFVPGFAGAIVLVLAALVCIAAAATDRTVLRASMRWLATAAGAAVFAIASVLAFVTANDYYVPDGASLFDRLNVMAAPAYCVLFVALCALLWTCLRRWTPASAATAVVGVLVALVATGQVSVERRSQEAWASSWAAQKSARSALTAIAPRLDRNASVMSFGHPIWERGFIPVLAADWDLAGMIAIETEVRPPAASPFTVDASCGPRAVLRGTVPYLAYRATTPLWFVNLSDRQARRISSRAACDAAVQAWGRPPFWGKSVTG